MPDDSPIVCTLTTAEMQPRMARIACLTRDHLRTHELVGNALRLTYEPGATSEVAEIVALERQCCAFLDFAVERKGDAVELRIVGPEGQGDDVRWLFSPFLPSTPSEAVPAPSQCRCCGG